jgi:phospholipase/carboxylesterase
MAHGIFDPIVSIDLASHSCDTLLNLNYNVLWNTYPMQHMVAAEEILDINNFLNKVLQ